MQQRSRPAIVTLRMSRSLRDALHSAAAAQGCSLNGYALQILAAAAGDPARFRHGAVDRAEGPRDIERDERGFPRRPAARSEHLCARQAFFEAMAAESGAVTAERLVRQHELEDPAFFVEWSRSREHREM
jgi:HicB family